MLGLFRRRLDSPAATVRSKLAITPSFIVESRGDDLVVSRRRLLPSRGVLRMLVPRVRARVSLGAIASEYSIQLDGLAMFMVVMLAGGIVVELTMDRATYPREYPPAFIYGLAGVYLLLIVYDAVMTDRSLRQLLTG